jgi:virulence-associated protein VapD
MNDNSLQSATCYRAVIRVLNAQGFFKDQFSVYTNQNTTVVHGILVGTNHYKLILKVIRRGPITKIYSFQTS